MPRQPSTHYLKAHKALLDFWECVDSLDRKLEMESLLDEINACDKWMRKKDPSLSTYQVNELTELMSMNEIRRNQQGNIVRSGGGNTSMDQPFAVETYGPLLVICLPYFTDKNRMSFLSLLIFKPITGLYCRDLSARIVLVLFCVWKSGLF